MRGQLWGVLLAVFGILSTAMPAFSAGSTASAPISVCALLSQPSKYLGSEAWVRGRMEFAPPDFGLTLQGCDRAVPLTWSETSPFERSTGRRALDVAQQELFKAFTGADRSASVMVTIAGKLRPTRNGRYEFEVTRLGSITINFLKIDQRRAGPVNGSNRLRKRSLRKAAPRYVYDPATLS